MSMRSLMASAAGAVILALSAGLDPLQAQGSPAEQQFVNQVAAENLMEVRLAQAAQQRATNPSVKQFAQRMVIDHTSMQKQWMAAAKKNGIDFRAEMSARHRQQAEQLRTLTGAAFDQTYMGLMVQNHQENVTTFQAQRNAGHSADVRQLIEVALPTLQEHLRTAQQIAGQVGGSVATNTGGQPVPTQPGRPAIPPVGQTPPRAPGGQTQPAPQPAPQPAQAQTVRADSLFIGEVNTSNNLELRLARIAENRASADVVKRFAQKMITDHTSMQRDWASVLARSGAGTRAANDPQMQGQVSRLQGLSGTDFDWAYMATMVANHREAVNQFQTARRTAQSSEVRELVARSLPFLQEHLTVAQQVASQVGSDTTIATISGDTDSGDTDRGRTGNINKDRKYIVNVDNHHMMEIRLGQIAEERGRDESVKEFGRRMARDHTELRKQWLTMISNSGMKFKSGMGPKHREKLDYLQQFSGREFDREYMTLMTKHHRGYVSYFSKEGRAANYSGVRRAVNRAIPMLQQHFQLAKRIGGRVGADTITVKVGPLSIER
jgi:putative membrane protein